MAYNVLVRYREKGATTDRLKYEVVSGTAAQIKTILEGYLSSKDPHSLMILGFIDDLSDVTTDLDEIKGTGFSTTTDSLKILSDVLDLIEGTGFNTATDSLKILSDVLDLIEGSGFNTATDSLKVLSDVLDLIRTEQTFEHQDDAVLNQNAPVSGQKYTVLNTTAKVRIISMTIQCTWTVQPSPLEIWVTIDGKTIRHFIDNPASATWHYAFLSAAESENFQRLGTSGAYNERKSFLWEGRSVKIEAEITGGTVSNLQCRVKYAKR